MGFADAVRSGFQNYVNFSGRSMRSEYWYWVLFTLLVNILANIIDPGGTLAGLAGLVFLLPGLAVAVRRLHDIGRSGWWLLVGLIPVLGWIYLIYLYIQPSEPQPNRFGPPPAGVRA